MKRLTIVQQRLGLKLFLSHLVIVIVGGAVMLTITRLHAPTAMLHHLERMKALVGDDPATEAALRTSFMDAVNEMMAIAVVAGMITAVLMSSYVARRIVGPIKRMKQASQRIAAGDYHERIQVFGQDELSALATSFNQMAKAMEQTELRRLELIGNVAHELRTPLSSIRVMMEGITDGVLPATPETYANFHHEFARLQRLVQDLQNLSRVEAGQFMVDINPADIVSLIKAAADRLRPQYDDKHVGLTLSLPLELPPIPVDPDRITEVLINLLGNALHYTPSGGHVTVTAHQQAHDLLISVADTGIGIPPEDLPHIFERFYRVDKSRSRAGGGSGIGLTIARHFVEAHGGQIWATSPGLNRGSTFSFTVPLPA